MDRKPHRNRNKIGAAVMSGAKLGVNGAKAHFGCNTNRPSGASPLAESRDAEALTLALEIGNRQTRRLAARNLRKVQRCAATSAHQFLIEAQ